MSYFTYLLYSLLSICLGLLCYFRFKRYISKFSNKSVKLNLAFFHPYCNSGGGGERVLWKIVEFLLTDSICKFKYNIIIYSGETNKSKENILINVKNKFGIDIIKSSESIKIFQIHTRFLLEAKWYPVATMICQALASIIVGLECLNQFTPDIYCDTTGEAFIYPFVYILGGSKVIAYVHYPTISTDMLNQVVEQRPSYNNNNIITSSQRISYIKQIYYKIFQYLYTFVGSFASIVMVNSSWTQGHIGSLWNLSTDSKLTRYVKKVYPPCNTEGLMDIPIDNKRDRIILSLGQFRPEKDQLLQLKSFYELLKNPRYQDVIMIMVGSTRNKSDEILLNNLKEEAKKLNIISNVHFMVNVPYDNLREWLSKASIGIHTMWNEHFGISIVEMMASGMIVIAHNSGGPKLDIIQPYDDNITGYLATTPQEYADAIRQILDLDINSDKNIRHYARLQSNKFSDKNFIESIKEIFQNKIS